jgi:serine/threonine-protein kinase
MSAEHATLGPTLGRYALERRIASGGMADVYLARQQGAYGFVKRVALKVLKREIAGDDENVKMFIREALVSAEFRHPNLAQVYEVGEVDGRLFIAMELVRGISVASLLRELVARDRTLPKNVAVRIAIDTLDGLAHAHEAHGPDGRALGLVHRDISPQNIMVAVDGSVKVVDFGIARAEINVAKTIAPRIKGKFSYMPPEQWEGREALDARADIFAVGIVLYEMTTGGVRLFRGDSPQDLYKAIVLDAIPDPRTREPDYPEPLARIVMRALERGPAARWPSARAMRTALLEYAQSQGWSLMQRAVSDQVRAAIGSGDVEDRWEPVAGAIETGESSSAPTDVDAQAPNLREAPTRPGRPAAGLAPPAIAPDVGRSTALAIAGAVFALVGGLLGGFALGRHTAPAPAQHVSVVVDRAIAAPIGNFRRDHPDIVIDVETASPNDALAALEQRRADVALVIDGAAPTPPGLRVGPAVRGMRVVTRIDASGAARTVADWIDAIGARTPGL